LYLHPLKKINPLIICFNKDGKDIKYEKMLKAAEGADIVLFGESHDNPISHWLQLELTKDLYNLKKDNLIT
jgi:uncharacterized iron-regulated protein